jgi:nucleoside-diphosphate-sugar epimerase
MKIVVTGSAGRLGSGVARALLAAGHEVVATDVRLPTEPTPEVRVVDLCHIDAVRELMQGAEAVCHLGNLPGFGGAPGATPIGRSKGFINNTATNYNVFLAATEAGVRRIVYASSIQAYGCCGYTSTNGPGIFSRPQYLPLDEDHPLNPVDAYPLSKAVGESIAASFCQALPDLTAWSMRFSGIAMPRPPRPPEARPPQPAPPQGAAPPGGAPRKYVPGAGPTLGSLCTWVHMEDAVRATVLACGLDRPGHTPLNILAQTSRPAWSPEALTAIFGAVPPFRRTMVPEEPLISPERAERLLGFRAEHRQAEQR